MSVAGEGRRLGAHALLEVAVGAEREDEVVEGGGAGSSVRVEEPALPPRGHGGEDKEK